MIRDQVRILYLLFLWLGCTVLREEALSVGTFGQRALKAEMREVVRLDLKSLRGSKVVSVEAYVVFQWMFEKDRILRGNPGEPVAIETVLGWVISGPIGGFNVEEPVTAQAKFVSAEVQNPVVDINYEILGFIEFKK